MGKKSAYNIGALIGNVHTNHPKELIQGICEAAKDYDVNIEFFLGTQSAVLCQEMSKFESSENYDYQFNTIYDYALLGDLDALIISYGTTNVFFEQSKKELFLKKFSAIPKVVLEEQEERPDTSYLISDNYQGITRIMEHLIVDHRYKKIAHISGPELNSDAKERKNAYLDAMSKYGLEVTENMMVCGNFSEFIDEKIEFLLDYNPGLEAICAANDEMAISAYRVCKKRGMVVGVDIAITGYDDFEMAQSLDPPLTTVDQNGYDMGYRALKCAVRLCKGENGYSMKLPVVFRKRSSCGCQPREAEHYFELLEQDGFDECIRRAAEKVVYDAVYNKENTDVSNDCTKKVRKMFQYLVDNYLSCEECSQSTVSKSEITDSLREIVAGRHQKFISSVTLVKGIASFITDLISLGINDANKMCLVDILTNVQMYIFSFALMSKEQEFVNYERKAWVGPLFVRDLMECSEDEKLFFYKAIEKIKDLNILSAYLYIFREPKSYPVNSLWETPKELYLAAYLEEGAIHTFEQKDRPVVTRKNGFSKYFTGGSGHIMISYTLFAADTQYGVLMCEMNQKEISSMYVNSLQIGTALRFMELAKKEKEAQVQLEKTLTIIQEKNEVLNFISEYDELTGMYNRRGFVENAYKFNKKNIEKKAYFVFADLDHLKQINDGFGHSEGDFAIVSVAQIIKQSVEGKGVVGRLGGDEIVSLLITEEEDFHAKLKNQFKIACQKLNEESGKPYYVEFSIGIKDFKCSEDMELMGILKEADVFLYEAKRLRRANIHKKDFSQ